MEAQIEKTRATISSNAHRYQCCANSLKMPAQFVRFPNENLMNKEVASVLEAAADILKCTTEKEVAVPQDFYVLDPKIQALQDQIEELSFEFENQAISFDDTVVSVRQMFSDQVYIMHKEYQSRITNLIINNTHEEIQLEKTLDSFRESFDDQIEKEFSSQIAERDEIQKQLLQLKREVCTETNSLTSSQIMTLNSRETTDYDLMIPSESQERDFSQTNYYYNCQEELEKKKTEKQRLTDELSKLQSFYSNEKSNLANKIEKAAANSEINSMRAIKKQESSYKRRIEQLDNLFKARENELNQKIALAEKANSSVTRKIKTEINEAKKMICDSDIRIHNAINDIDSNTLKTIANKEKEKTQIKLEFEKEIKNININHQNTIKKLMNENNMSKIALDQKIQQKFEVQSKILKSPLPRRTESQQNLNSNLEDKLSDLERASSMEAEAISKAIFAVEDQYNINNRILQSSVDRSRRLFIATEKKKEIVALKIDNINLISTEFSKYININSISEQQQKTIEELNQKLQLVKEGNISKVELSVIQNEYKNEIDSKKESLEKTRIKTTEMMENTKTRNSSLLLEEQKKRQKQLKNISSMLSEAEEELRKTREALNDDSMKEFFKLNKKEIDQKSGNESSPRTASVQRLQMEAKFQSSLPLLKH